MLYVIVSAAVMPKDIHGNFVWGVRCSVAEKANPVRDNRPHGAASRPITPGVFEPRCRIGQATER